LHHLNMARPQTQCYLLKFHWNVCDDCRC
jgi:hypothetical protein